MASLYEITPYIYNGTNWVTYSAYIQGSLKKELVNCFIGVDVPRLSKWTAENIEKLTIVKEE